METIEIYRAILLEAKEAGYFEGEIPEKEEDLVNEAAFWIRSANEAKGAEAKNKTVVAIKNLASQLAVNVDEDIFGAPLNDKFRGLPIPEDPPHDPTPLPIDFTEIGDKQLRRLHGEYHAHLSRALWMQAIATNNLSSATHLRDEEYRKLYKKFHEDLEKPTKDLVDSHVKNSSSYKEKDILVRKHSDDLVSYKALVEIYKGSVDRLSREWTMRQDEEKRY